LVVLTFLPLNDTKTHTQKKGHLRQLLFDRSVGTEQSLSAPANNSTVDYLQFWQGLVRQGRVHSVNELQSVVPLDNDPLTDELANLFTAACESGCSGQVPTALSLSLSLLGIGSSMLLCN